MELGITMKNQFFVLLAVLGLGCLPPVTEECGNDNDCKGNRVCVDGSCESPGGDDDGGPSSGPGGTVSDCGEITMECNCGYTWASPGSVEQNTSCDSGLQIYDVCGQCPTQYAWYTYCACGE